MRTATTISSSLLIGALFGLIAACAPWVPEAAPNTSVLSSRTTTSDTAADTPTPTATYTSTITPTMTPSATGTPTASATITATPIPTRTLTRVPLPTHAPTSRPEAPVFSQTSIIDWNADDFRKELTEYLNGQTIFLASMKYIVENGIQGDCRYFYNYRNEIIVSQAGYRNVPDPAYELYFQYRVLLQQTIATIQPITSACDAGGGDVSPEQDQAIIDFTSNSIIRVQSLIAQAAMLP